LRKIKKMINKKVSVIIPAYNMAELTLLTVKSVLRQTYKNIEIIVVDDGSKDETREVLKEVEEKIRYVYKENGGASSARNLGIINSTGEYIALLDCDDLYLPGKIEKAVEALDNDPKIGFVHTGAYFINSEGYQVKEYSPKKKQREGNIFSKLLLGNYICNSTVVARRQCFEKCGTFDETIFVPADWDMWLRISAQYNAGYIKEPLTIYRIPEGDDRLNYSKESKIDQLIVLEKVFNNYEIPVSLQKRLISRIYYRQAIDLMLKGEIIDAKKKLVCAIKKYFLNIKAYLVFGILSIFGEKVTKVIKFFRKRCK